MYNILFTNAGRRATLLQFCKQSLGDNVKIVATDSWSVAPALFFADKYYITPKFTDKNYVDKIFEICELENIQAITSLYDEDTYILSKYKDEFEKRGIIPLIPDEKTAELCLDKYLMFRYLKENNIPTVLTFDSIESFNIAKNNGEIGFPVFIKPRTGCGSVGAKKINSNEELINEIKPDNSDYVIQEYFENKDIDIDFYVDYISKQVVSVFSKNKIETRIGGTSKSISFKDEKLFDFVKMVAKKFELAGPNDIEVFYKDEKYYFGEINPRFSGAYLNAFGAKVDFFKYMANNIDKIENKEEIGNYENDVIMLMYDNVVITDKKSLKKDYKE